MVRDVPPPSQQRVRGASLGLPATGPGSLAASAPASPRSSSTRCARPWPPACSPRRSCPATGACCVRRVTCSRCRLRADAGHAAVGAAPGASAPGPAAGLWRAVVRTALLLPARPGPARRRRRPRPARPAHRHRRRPRLSDRPSERPRRPRGRPGLHLAAFAVDPVTGALRSPQDVPEAPLVDALREDAGFLPHLRWWPPTGTDRRARARHPGWLEPPGTPVLGLGPLGVHPDVQGRGSGPSSCTPCSRSPRRARNPVALVGSPGYYSRFGFTLRVRARNRGARPPLGRAFPGTPADRAPCPGDVQVRRAVRPGLKEDLPAPHRSHARGGPAAGRVSGGGPGAG